jgi:outer membrane lipoprotein SlyB
MRTRTIALALAASLALSGCYTTKYAFSANDARAGETHKEFQQTFFWGLISIGRVDLDKQCGPAGIKRMESKIGGWGLLANWVTGGIWAPVTVKITCAE